MLTRAWGNSRSKRVTPTGTSVVVYDFGFLKPFTRK